MATFGEIIYAVLDLLKERSDDAYYTEEHIMFLATNVRNLLLNRKYRGSRNMPFSAMSEENKQQVCLQLARVELLPAGCAGNWLKSTAKIPELLDVSVTATCTGHDLLFTNVTFIAPERMPYVGYNKWLGNIIYAARSIDGYLYMKSNNPQFVFLEQAGLTGVFADPVEAAKLSHEACTTGRIDIMEQKFPLESALVPQLIELVVQEIAGPRYAPEDKANNAKDDLSEVALRKNTATPVNNEERAAEQEEQQ